MPGARLKVDLPLAMMATSSSVVIGFCVPVAHVRIQERIMDTAAVCEDVRDSDFAGVVDLGEESTEVSVSFNFLLDQLKDHYHCIHLGDRSDPVSAFSRQRLLFRFR